MQRTILVADDQEDIRALIRVTLDGDEFRVLEARSGDELLALAQTSSPHLVLLDVSMPPGIDGFETCRRLRANATTQGARIIMLTASGREEDRERARSAGADDYFVKPFSPLQLLTCIYGTLET